MRGLFIQDKADKVTLSALNYYGANFTADVFDQDNNTYIYQNLQMTESSEPFTAANTTSAEARAAGVESIKVDSTTSFEVHDKIILDSGAGEVFRIISIDATNKELGIHKGTKIDITTSTKVTKSGNMGLYYLDLTMSQTGTFLIKAKDSVFGLSRTDAIKVVGPKQAKREFKVMV